MQFRNRRHNLFHAKTKTQLGLPKETGKKSKNDFRDGVKLTKSIPKTDDMSLSSAAYLDHQEQLHYTECEPSLNELIEFIQIKPKAMKIPHIPYIRKHALLLDRRNDLYDIVGYSERLTQISRDHKSFWAAALERHYFQLLLIENQLMEVESSMS